MPSDGASCHGLREAPRWLDSLGVTRVATEATGDLGMTTGRALLEHGNF
jgi:hypothetical protein